MVKEVENLLKHSQEYPFDLNATNLVNQWYRAKKHFIDRFNGQLIVKSKTPIKVTLSEDQRRRRFSDFLLTLDSHSLLTNEFEEFLKENEPGFFENRAVRSNTKLSKLFKNYLSDDQELREAQDIASRYIQENKIEGYLYLSVDPRDYLTLSENQENWWSCHTLDGGYRAGNLNYMVDNTTIVAYLAADEQKPLKCLSKGTTWNSKKWRMLIHVGGNRCIWYNKQYPYESDALLMEAHKMLQSYFEDTTFALPQNYGFKTIQTYYGLISVDTNQLYLGERIFDTRDIVDAQDYNGYCDLIYSTSYTPVIAFNKEMLDNYYAHTTIRIDGEQELFQEMASIKIGKKALCPCCGYEYIQRESSFLCPSCIAEKDADEDFYLKCDGCDHHIYESDHVHRVNDKFYCHDCYKYIIKES